jgi:hypothetical protein
MEDHSMDAHSIDDHDFLMRIDACRPGSDDVQSPDMAPVAARIAADPLAQNLYHRLQASDAVVAGALAAVSVPAGLEQRLLARLAAANRSPGSTLAHVDEAIVAATEATPSPDDARPTTRSAGASRRWLGITAALATAAALALIGWNQFSTEAITLEALPERAAQYFSQDDRAAEPATEAWPISRQIPRRAGATRRGVSDFLDREAVAYDLRYRRVKATLYVVQATVDGLPNSPPMRPDATTGGYAVGSWQDGDLLYVLVVSGSEREYRRFVEPPGGVA